VSLRNKCHKPLKSTLASFIACGTGFKRQRPQQMGPEVVGPRATTLDQDRLIVRHHRREPWIPAKETTCNTIGTTGKCLCSRAVRRRLVAVGLHCKCPCQRAVLTPCHRLQRLQWAKARELAEYTVEGSPILRRKPIPCGSCQWTHLYVALGPMLLR